MKYRIKFVDPSNDRYNDTYYSNVVNWGGVSIDKASKLSHKDACKIRNHLKQPRIGIPCIIEEAGN
jgi:hypothetical protein